MRPNLVLNDDTVMCSECWNELMSTTLRIDTPDDLVMGSSTEPCKWCGYDPVILASRSLSESGKLP